MFNLPTTTIEKLPDFNQYRPSAGIVVTNGKGQILACERADIQGAWQLPQGGIDAGEIPEQAARRELFEETGIAQIRLVATTPYWSTYDFPPESRAKHPGNPQLGQAQRWFLFRYTGKDSEIDLSKAEHQEFSQWRWVSPEEMLATVALFRKPNYEKALAYFKPYFHISKRPVTR